LVPLEWARAGDGPTPPKAPKLKALAKNPKVSLTIDDNTFPHKVLLIRGIASLQRVDGIVPEYVRSRGALFWARARDWRGSSKFAE
jgi:hypothetical protein